MMVMATILLAPFMLVGGLVLVILAVWVRIVPGGSGAVVGYFLVICAGYGLLYLANTVDQLVLTPARFQQQTLEERVAGPLSLVSYERSGFQDPYWEWQYDISDARVRRLLPRCRWDSRPGPHGQPLCLLNRPGGSVSLPEVTLEGNQLRIVHSVG